MTPGEATAAGRGARGGGGEAAPGREGVYPEHCSLCPVSRGWTLRCSQTLPAPRLTLRASRATRVDERCVSGSTHHTLTRVDTPRAWSAPCVNAASD